MVRPSTECAVAISRPAQSKIFTLSSILVYGRLVFAEVAAVAFLRVTRTLAVNIGRSGCVVVPFPSNTFPDDERRRFGCPCLSPSTSQSLLATSETAGSCERTAALSTTQCHHGRELKLFLPCPLPPPVAALLFSLSPVRNSTSSFKLGSPSSRCIAASSCSGRNTAGLLVTLKPPPESNKPRPSYRAGGRPRNIAPSAAKGFLAAPNASSQSFVVFFCDWLSLEFSARSFTESSCGSIFRPPMIFFVSSA
mmetsp:Transcript_22412/g.56633  ORF Transcript_22412/g.56633 Transcript_22412/m.56633 type:complete len:251 (-) Transcript_22412:1760-2512(-)